ncbi:MAG: NTP transferase domain-containing protein [Gammaproteobacteria bacterium]|nr:NTP transferase domain-containing protein [Gammaproteobacteria bacterium]MDC0185742.1 NTP transferase domain-containing protein [Gammaproteobacteria bacterium]
MEKEILVNQGVMESKIHGLILTGGYSKRMGQDKALISDGNQTALEKIYDLLRHSLEEVFVSVRADQKVEEKRAEFNLIIDQNQYSGPMAGILSAFNSYPNIAWLIVACDMPHLDKETIDQLIQNRNKEKVATLFISPKDGLPEPLCSIYEPLFFETVSNDNRLIENNSPRDTLMRMDTVLIQPKNPKSLINTNYPERI